MIKILAVGHSIVKGANDGNEIAIGDLRLRPPSPLAPHLPEGGWNHGKFQVKPRWGDGAPDNIGGPGWVVRVTDEFPPGAVQVFNEGYSGGTALDWDPQGNNFIGRIFDRIDEPLPADIDLAVVAIMANDIWTASELWRGQVGRVVDFLEGRGIRTILVYDWFRGLGKGEYHTGDSTKIYDAMCAKVDELVKEKNLLPPLDIRTLSEQNYKRDGATFCSDLEAWHTHPNTAGMIEAAKAFAEYLREHSLLSCNNKKDPKTNMNIKTISTIAGTAFEMLPSPGDTPAPTLLLFASTGQDTLSVEPYCLVGRLLHAQGWNVVSMDLSCHGADRRAGEPEELAGWADRIRKGEDIVAAFQTRVNDVVAHLVSAGVADPARIAAAGTSRGGFLAFHAAAGNQLIRAVAAFAPVTDLLALSEFAGQEQNQLVQCLALINAANTLVDRSTWITIGNADTRVDTDMAVAFSRALAKASNARSLACDVTLRVLPAIGHCSDPQWHNEAAEWFLQTVVSTVRILPAPEHPLAVPCTVFPPVVKPGRKAGMVVHLYGRGGSHSLYNMICPCYAKLRRCLREAGYWLIVPDLGPSHWMNARSVSILDAIIAGIVAKDGVDPDRVHLLGTSMGGGSSLIYASKRPKTIRSLCAVFPMTDLEVWTAEKPGYLASIAQAHGIDTSRANTALHDISPIHHIEALSKIPIFLLHGEADETVPVHHSRDFAAALIAIGGDVVYHEVSGVGHDDGIATDWQEEIFSFIINTGAVRKTIKS